MCRRVNRRITIKDLQIIPFNISHAKRTGEFAKTVFANKGTLNLTQRVIIPNDTKLFAQADVEFNIGYYLSSDSESKKIYDLLAKENKPKFTFIELTTPYSETFGLLDFDSL